MSVTSERDLERLQAAAEVVRRVLAAMRLAIRPGITTAELDELGAEVIRKNQARSAPAVVYGFPGHNCISINEEAVHGVPGQRVLCAGDLLKLDVTVEKDGYMADAAITLPVDKVSSEKQRLITCAERAFHKAMLVARSGLRILDIGRTVEREVCRYGFSVIRELCGHGIGRNIHEAPRVPNYPDPTARQRLTEGLVITVEPIIAAGHGEVSMAEDGWTVRTSDGRPSAHYEHTIVITKGNPIILTA